MKEHKIIKKHKTPVSSVAEAKRYLNNAREILKSKGGNGIPGYYSDPKYVKMACHTAWCGVLVALDAKIPPLPRGIRKTVNTYRQYLAPRNRKILNDFVADYQILHLLGGYDGSLHKRTIHTGLELAEDIINWCAKN